ncbi:Hypothetical protein ORPV_179 [Orpheovirus IHUMI-LCC2]|uniref:Uncharacterized protein n=1 Tax=Orpheovirus IHUMI-LCC2 TaxID=2023057 RepID=A0A2I2L3I8_9VIRU|nr:Hypothetical protein ORPV_179 [Orpheovirus IHUMI-LCC2]SNW62083.1 Hypothetical protein ORPV_179 [Orpheovirus IHUMI-LCC2]
MGSVTIINMIVKNISLLQKCGYNILEKEYQENTQLYRVKAVIPFNINIELIKKDKNIISVDLVNVR